MIVNITEYQEVYNKFAQQTNNMNDDDFLPLFKSIHFHGYLTQECLLKYPFIEAIHLDNKKTIRVGLEEYIVLEMAEERGLL